MKIVYLAHSIIPSRTANSIHVMKMCQAFVKNGHEVILLTPDYAECEQGINNPYDFYGVSANFVIKKLPWSDTIKGKMYVYGLIAGLKAKQLKPDLVYGRCLQSCFFSCILGLPVIYEAHSLSADMSRISAAMLKHLINSKNLKKLVVISQALSKAFQQKYGISEEMITVAPDAADETEKYDNVASPIYSLGELKVGYIGHLYAGKGMEIVAKLVKACPFADFHIIGGNEADINYWKNELNEVNNIFFYGFIPHAKTDLYRQACDVLIAPYLRQVTNCGGGEIGQWMSPLKLFEYMAAGKPIIASDLPVLREVLTHEKTALLYEPENISGWIEGLTRLRDNIQLRKFLAINALQEFKTNYTWKARADKVINSVINNGRKSS